MTVSRTHKAYMRGAIWVLALVGLALLPGLPTTDRADAQPVETASQ